MLCQSLTHLVNVLDLVGEAGHVALQVSNRLAREAQDTVGRLKGKKRFSAAPPSIQPLPV